MVSLLTFLVALHRFGFQSSNKSPLRIFFALNEGLGQVSQQQTWYRILLQQTSRSSKFSLLVILIAEMGLAHCRVFFGFPKSPIRSSSLQGQPPFVAHEGIVGKSVASNIGAAHYGTSVHHDRMRVLGR